SGYRVVGHDPPKRRGDCDLRRGFRWKWRRLGVEQDLVDRRQLTKQPEKCYKFGGRGRTYRSIEQLRLEFTGSREERCVASARDAAEHVRRHPPGRGGGP